jgi:hypothetical protein
MTAMRFEGRTQGGFMPSKDHSFVDWELLAMESPLAVALQIRDCLQNGDSANALRGLEELIDALARSEECELRLRMEILMAHILKWKTQPPGTKSWRLTINEQRRQIAELRQDNPRFTEEYIRARWPRYLRLALAKAADEMDQPAAIDTLSWEEVFEHTIDERSQP